MKTYRGDRTIDGIAVTVDGKPLPQRTDIAKLSSDGFEWSYEGQAPAQLALALLADHLGDEHRGGDRHDDDEATPVPPGRRQRTVRVAVRVAVVVAHQRRPARAAGSTGVSRVVQSVTAPPVAASSRSAAPSRCMSSSGTASA